MKMQLQRSTPEALTPHLLRQVKELRCERAALLEEAGTAILFLSPTTRKVLEANAAAALLFRCTPQQLIGHTLQDLLAAASSEKLGGCCLPHDEQDHQWQRVVLRREDGTPLAAALSSRLLRRDGLPLRMLILHPLAAPSKAEASHSVAMEACEQAFPHIIGKSRAIRSVCMLIGKVAKTNSTVLIQGESGTGKEVIAKAIHYHSRRSRKPFVPVNCAALTESLLESELFGHVKGAFTGAVKHQKGRLGQAQGGTLLLDEVGSMSLSGQAKLLRVLQEREYEPVGSSVTQSLDVRVIATTNVDLRRAVKARTFREDLFYRLSVISIYLLPLKERKEDIPLLANAFLRRYSRRMNKELVGFDTAALQRLLAHPWPGNVRELENIIERAVIVEEEDLIRADSLALPTNTTAPRPLPPAIGLRQQLTMLEKQIVLQALGRCNWVRKDAAHDLGIDPRNFNYFLRKHNITEPEEMMTHRR